MRYLLDTHAILWALSGDRRLSEKATATYESSAHGHFSIVSLWETGIKLGLRRPDFSLSPGWHETIPRELTKLGFTRLEVTSAHCLTVSNLPQFHKDPFDRMLIAQAMDQDLEILSADEKFDAYPVTRIW